MEEGRNYNWMNPNISLFDPYDKSTRDNFSKELKKPRDKGEIITAHVEFLFKTYTDVTRDGNEDCFKESIADTDANITYPLISEKLRGNDITEKGRKKRLFAVKVLGRLARLNLENKDAVNKIIGELSRVKQEDEDLQIRIEATKERAKILERFK